MDLIFITINTNFQEKKHDMMQINTTLNVFNFQEQ